MQICGHMTTGISLHQNSLDYANGGAATCTHIQPNRKVEGVSQRKSPEGEEHLSSRNSTRGREGQEERTHTNVR